MKKWALVLTVGLLLLLLFAAAHVIYYTRDRNPGYTLDLTPAPPQQPSAAPFQVGLAAETITPEHFETWADVDSNARYQPKKGDVWEDKDGDGKFDALWLAGFQNSRAAQGVHDDIWARAIVWDDGQSHVAYVVLDAIGFFHDDVIDVREMVRQQHPDIDHVIVSSIHNHEVPDLMGLWGKSFLKSGVNKEYKQFVKQRAVQAVGEAWENRIAATLKIARIDSAGRDLIDDSRPPEVYDDVIRMMLFTAAHNDSVMGILLNYGDHPETLGSDNLLITADFANYWLGGIEQGIYYDGESKRAGVGGIAVWANGAVGGLMTSLHSTVHDPWLNKDFRKASFDKARAQGYRLADAVLDHIQNGDWQTLTTPRISLRAKTFNFEVKNKIFKLGAALGILNRGFTKFKYMRSEVDLLTIGPAWILTVPGEINPEILNGGIETPEGRDFDIEPVEVPPLRELMQGDINFVIGLANDEVGYMMPKTHWDTKAPFTYGRKKGMYGEVNSLGPDTGPEVYRQARMLIDAAAQK